MNKQVRMHEDAIATYRARLFIHLERMETLNDIPGLQVVKFATIYRDTLRDSIAWHTQKLEEAGVIVTN